MKHVHVLPTDKPSTLFKDDFGNLIYSINMDQEQNHFEPQHLFITSDEEIKEGDWYEHNGVIFKADDVFDEGNNPNNSNPRVTDWNKKIILTTDQSLDGVQAIDDEFLEWFVNNPSCEEIELEEIEKYESTTYDQPDRFIGYDYKIIIPKEKSKQETPEEVAHKMLVDYGIKSIGQSIGVPTVKKLMVNMAKWQAERMYSKEDLKEVYFSAIKSTGEGRNGECASGNSPVDIKKEFTEEFEEWFEQFKKK